MARQLGNFTLERTLGAGSFATVWLAHDPVLDDRVAIKILAENWSANDDVRRRFTEEARILRRIDHERVIRVHTISQTPDGRPYFVMSWADAGSLRDRILDRRAGGGGFPMSEVVELGREVLDALAVVHDFGAVHRDLKPSNLLFRTVSEHERKATARLGGSAARHRLVLGDFGLAKDLALASGFTQAAGTPAYMAPEQARASAVIDHRADLYAVGAVLFELIVGRPPFTGRSLVDVVDQDRSGWAAAMRDRGDVPDAIVGLIAQALQLDPQARPSSTAEMITRLSSVPVTTDHVTTVKPVVSFSDDDLESLPGPLRAEVERFLSSDGPARFGLDPSVGRDVESDAMTVLLDRWRSLVNSGRVPFRARPVAQRFIASVEAAWSDLQR